MTAAPPPRIRCRQISAGDLDAVARLLCRGFPTRSRDYWRRGLMRHTGRAVPSQFPRYGYLLEADGEIVGVILLLFNTVAGDGVSMTRCNISSWYVEPAYRSHASMLICFALRHKDVTYFNVSPSQGTWSTVEAQGFSTYCDGQFFAVPALSRAEPRARAVAWRPDLVEFDRAGEEDLLAAHASYGCLSLVVTAADGSSAPFVFRRFSMKSGAFPLPCMRLIYCRDIADFVRFAGVIGRYLIRRGIPFVVLDANGPVPGLVGKYRSAGGRKYFRGPRAPRLGDLAWTEFALFGD